MKFFVLVFLSLMVLSAFHHKDEHTIPSLTCTLTADKTQYKIGELPAINVAIANNTGKDIYLIGSLDGSDVKWRMPYCYFTIEKPKPDTNIFPRCGTLNRLRKDDFILVKAGEEFNPYQSIDHYGFFGDLNLMNPETFKNPGVYRIRFHYSTNSPDINKFINRSGYDKSFNEDSVKLSPLFNRVPKIEIASNEIEIRFVK